eukprot:3531027-Rhodomonas_salina.3
MLFKLQNTFYSFNCIVTVPVIPHNGAVQIKSKTQPQTRLLKVPGIPHFLQFLPPKSASASPFPPCRGCFREDSSRKEQRIRIRRKSVGRMSSWGAAMVTSPRVHDNCDLLTPRRASSVRSGSVRSPRISILSNPTSLPSHAEVEEWGRRGPMRLVDEEAEMLHEELPSSSRSGRGRGAESSSAAEEESDAEEDAPLLSGGFIPHIMLGVRYAMSGSRVSLLYLLCGVRDGHPFPSYAMP